MVMRQEKAKGSAGILEEPTGEQDIGLFFFLMQGCILSAPFLQLIHPMLITRVLLAARPPSFTKDASKEDLASQKDGTSEAPSSSTTLAGTEANSSQADLDATKHHDHTMGHIKLSKNTTTSS